MAVPRTYRDSSRIIPVAPREPAKAASTIPAEEMATPCPSRNSMAMATVSLAPEEMPST